MSGRRDDVPGTVVHEFVVLVQGWEMDPWGWVTNDGATWWTSHGGHPQPMSINTLQELIDNTQSCFDGLIRARDLAKEAK